MLGCVVSTQDFSTCCGLVFCLIERVWVGAERSKNVKSKNRPVYFIFVNPFFRLLQIFYIVLRPCNTIIVYNFVTQMLAQSLELVYYYITAQHNTTQGEQHGIRLLLRRSL